MELKEKKHRIEDALSATRAAVEEGIVAGGGTALVRSRAAVQTVVDSLTGDEATGASIVAKALAEPLQCIANNAGLEGSVIRPSGRVGDRHRSASTPPPASSVDLVKAGVIDPAKVTRSALQNAASIAGLLLTTEALVADKPEKADPAAAAAAAAAMGGGMGGHGRHDVRPPGRSGGQERLWSAGSFGARPTCVSGPESPRQRGTEPGRDVTETGRQRR